MHNHVSIWELYQLLLITLVWSMVYVIPFVIMFMDHDFFYNYTIAYVVSFAVVYFLYSVHVCKQDSYQNKRK